MGQLMRPGTIYNGWNNRLLNELSQHCQPRLTRCQHWAASGESFTLCTKRRSPPTPSTPLGEKVSFGPLPGRQPGPDFELPRCALSKFVVPVNLRDEPYIIHCKCQLHKSGTEKGPGA